MPPRQVPAIRSDSEAHAWLKLKKRGRKLALRVLTFPTSRQHVSPREINVSLFGESNALRLPPRRLWYFKKPEIRNRWLCFKKS